jgi:hypothetical protein
VRIEERMKKFAISPKANILVIILLGMGIAFFICSSVLSIIRDRNTYLNESRHITSAKAQLLGENATSVLYDVDLFLIAIRSLWQSSSDAEVMVPFAVKEFIQTQLNFLPQVSNIVIFSADGAVQFSSEKVVKFHLPSMSRHRDEWLDFYAGTAMVGTGQKQILLSRRVENHNSEFRGVVAATIDPIIFYKRYESYLNIDVEGITLFDTAGVVLTGWINQADRQLKVAEANIREIPLFAHAAEQILASGGITISEDRNHILSSFQLADFPFHILVASQKKSVLAKWHHETIVKGGLIAIGGLLAGIALILLVLQRRKKQIAEKQLNEYQLHLEAMVEQRTNQLSEINVELTHKNLDLQKALNEIKTLSGMLPICSHCKKIRDDSGYWNQIEMYIRAHSEIEFSHGICPACAETYYPGMGLYDDQGT